jgi:hypothetical protein
MSPETPEQNDLHTWHKKLKTKHESCSLTLEEATLFALLDIRNNMIHQSGALEEIVKSHEHVEGMVGSMDDYLQTTVGAIYPGYKRKELGASSSPVPIQGANLADATTRGDR